MRTSGVNLTQRESLLIAETQPAALSQLDADALIDLHTRVRRARNKYVTLYRRRGAAKVGAKGARGVAAEANQRGWDKAEVFEEALARVSRQLAAAAARSAREIKQERLAQARKETAAPASGRSGDIGTARPRRGIADQNRKSPVRKKTEASARAAGARRQAKRDSR